MTEGNDYKHDQVHQVRSSSVLDRVVACANEVVSAPISWASLITASLFAAVSARATVVLIAGIKRALGRV